MHVCVCGGRWGRKLGEEGRGRKVEEGGVGVKMGRKVSNKGGVAGWCLLDPVQLSATPVLMF